VRVALLIGERALGRIDRELVEIRRASREIRRINERQRKSPGEKPAQQSDV